MSAKGHPPVHPNTIIAMLRVAAAAALLVVAHVATSYAAKCGPGTHLDAVTDYCVISDARARRDAHDVDAAVADEANPNMASAVDASVADEANSGMASASMYQEGPNLIINSQADGDVIVNGVSVASLGKSSEAVSWKGSPSPLTGGILVFFTHLEDHRHMGQLLPCVLGSVAGLNAPKTKCIA